MATGTVLIIEDERNLVGILTDYLKGEGYRVESAFDGARGLELWRAARPDLVLLD
ncbi:MAG: response regulator, partial [Trueperaceae bacterium]|nr:response regulator [Trueperaceae bacterium]